MSDVNAVIVQPFKQFVKARRAASKTSISGTRPPPSRPLRHHTTAPLPRRREAHHATHTPAPRRRRDTDAPAASRPLRHPLLRNTHTPPPRRRRRRDTDTSHTQDSIHLVKKCTKPDRKEFARIASATMIGFLIMGFVGFFVKLVHIPINNILMT